MALKGSSSPKQKKISRALSTALLSAVQEWLLIFMLFVSALYSYLIAKYARYCKLQIPCLLCSRLDHVLGKEKPGYLWHMICVTHRLEISSLVSCQAHHQLVDVHNMCESCLFSFATINKSNAETYRLLVGKLGEDTKDASDEDPLLESPMLQNQKTKRCSCCNELWTSKGYVQKLIHARRLENEGVEFDLPLPSHVGQNEDLKNKQEQSLLTVENACERSQCDSPSHIGYKEVKFTSDTESEVSTSKDDDGDARAVVCEITSPGVDLSVQYEQLKPCIMTLSDDLVTGKSLQTDPALSLPHSGYKKVNITSDTESEVSMSNDDDGDTRALVSELPSPRIDLPIQSKQVEPCFITLADSSITEKLLETDPAPDHSRMIANSQDSSTSFFASAIEHHSEEFKQKHDGNNSDSFASEELMRFDGVPQVTGGSKSPAEASINSNFTPVIDGLIPTQVIENKKVIPSEEVPSSSKAIELPLDVPESKSQASPDEALSKDATEDGEVVSKDQSGPMVPGQAQQTCVYVSKTLNRSGNNEVDSAMSVLVCENCLRGSSSLDLGDAYKLAVGNKGKQLSGMLAEQFLGKDSSRVSEDLKLLLSQLSAARGLDQQMNDMSPRISASNDEWKASAPSTSTGMQILQKRISLERNESSLSIDGSIVSEIEGESEVDRLRRQVEHDMRTMKSLYKELEEERNASTVAANQAMAMITRLQEEKATIHMEALQSVRMMEEQAEFDIEALQEANDLLVEREKEIQDLEAELELYRQRYPSCDMKSIDIGVDYSEHSCDEGNIKLQRHSVSEALSIYNQSQETELPFSEILSNTEKILFLEDEASDILRKIKELEKKLFLLSDSAVEPDSTPIGDTENEVDQIHKPREPDVGECSQESNGGESDYSLRDSSGHKGNSIDSLESEISSLNSRLEALEADRKYLTRIIYALKNGREGLECIQEIANNLRELQKFGMKKMG